ncbi:hypothetical protein ABVK25_008881 [Lepraria finkii]|uniref:Uncharacterized protein n=1 Tax=Lepraria finkii TaxID=1340010 RepID=A0ABR4AZS5_9LECA
MSWRPSPPKLRSLKSNSKSFRLRRYHILVLFIVTIFFWWRYTAGLAKFYCGDPAQPPASLSESQRAQQGTPDDLANTHDPIVVESESIYNVNLNTAAAADDRPRVLVLTPLRDAASHLATHFELLSRLTYPHHSIDLAFLIGDSTDDTLDVLRREVIKLQEKTNPAKFRTAKIVQKDFGANFDQSVDDRHSFHAQGTRRRGIGRARNYLLYAALKPEHSWVYWRDVDIVENPEDIIEEFMAHDKDVLVPNIWFHRYDEKGKDIEGRYDYNSWQESWRGRRLAARLDKDTILAEGYKEYRTHRKYLAWMTSWRSDPKREVTLDGIGGVNILVKADLHRSGINFPCYAFENQADTEGFAAMAKRAGYQVYGLPHYIVWHVDTEEKEGNLKGNRAQIEAKEARERERAQVRKKAGG